MSQMDWFEVVSFISADDDRNATCLVRAKSAEQAELMCGLTGVVAFPSLGPKDWSYAKGDVVWLN